jgi:hypothetical protein
MKPPSSVVELPLVVDPLVVALDELVSDVVVVVALLEPEPVVGELVEPAVPDVELVVPLPEVLLASLVPPSVAPWPGSASSAAHAVVPAITARETRNERARGRANAVMGDNPRQG